MATGTLRQYLAFLPQAALLGIARALPYRARLAFASLLLRSAVALVPDLRHRVDANLRMIFPAMPADERRRIRSEMADSFGRTFIEIFTMRAFQEHAAWSPPAGPGWDALQAALAEGRGALLVGGHFGQWEAVRGALRTRGIEVGALYRPVKNPYLERDYFENLSAGGGPMLPRDRRGMRELVRHLRGNGVAAILLDQYVRGGEPIDFLGHPAPTGLTIAELALRYRLPMIPIYGTRQPDGEHVVIDFEAPIPHTTAREMTQALADSLSARVRERPGQYYWLHRRWVKKLPRD
jgi:KDO2-lipid IV(A) lauroyltransferase